MMEKNRLNNEIILCRPMVRKARVIVIRKTLKKMRILNSCKNPEVKEKKLKKASTLYKKIQVMKKLKDDEVTKFALINDNYDMILKKYPKNIKKSALASLAKHATIVKKVTFIREQIPNWKTELPLLLTSKKKKLNKGTQKLNLSTNPELSKNIKTNTNLNGRQNNGTIGQRAIETNKIRNDSTYKTGSNKTKSQSGLIKTPEKKIIDSFFLDKKINMPKLLKNGTYKEDVSPECKHHNKNYLIKKKKIGTQKLNKNSVFGENELATPKYNKNEMLHPSWAAKKLKLIQPFQGKKIKFSDN